MEKEVGDNRRNFYRLLLCVYCQWSYVKKKYKLNVPNFHVPAGQVSLQEPQQILPLLSDILLRTD